MGIMSMIPTGQELLEMSFGFVALPRVLSIRNYKLGIIHRLLQVCAVIYIIYVLLGSKIKVVPTPFQTSVWSESASSSSLAGTPAYCTGTAATYTYNQLSYVSKPDRCVTVPIGEAYIRGSTDVMYPTQAKDFYTWTRSPAACDDAAETSCNAGTSGAGYTTTFTNTSDGCTCQRTVEFLFKHAEQRQFVFNHGFTVDGSTLSGKIFSRASAAKDAYVHDIDKKDGETSKLDEELLTIIKTEKGDDCVVGANWARAGSTGGPALSKWKKQSALAGIGGTVDEWLKCGGFSLGLDTQTSSMRLDGDNIAPHARVTGARIILDLTYTDSHDEDHDGPVCYVYVSAQASWNGVNSMAYTLPFDIVSGDGDYRYRESHGVTITTATTGHFSFWDRQFLLTAVVSSIVLLGVPATIVQLIALNCIGLVSKIYKTSQNVKFDIPSQLHGVCTRMLASLQSYEGIAPGGSLQQPVLEDKLTKAFNNQVVDGTLQKEEIERLAEVVYKALDAKGGGIAGEDFLHACTSNETLNMTEVAKLFDGDRKRGIGEKLLSGRMLNEMIQQKEKAEPGPAVVVVGKVNQVSPES